MKNRGLRRVGTILLIVLAAAFAWLVVLVAWLWRNQERVVFQPPPVSAGRIEPARRVEFLADDGQPLFGFLIEAPGGERAGPVVIAFHGNADLAALFIPWGAELARRSGATVFLPEYRGYGGITGQPTYATAASDARGALAYTQSALPGRPIVLFGHSLGSAVAAELAAGMRPACAALVLQSPFTSAMDMAARMLVPPVPALWNRISRVHYDTRAVVSRFGAPVWVAHGSRDVVVPVRMGRAVFAAARHKGELLIVPGAGHNDVPDMGGEDYWAWLTGAVSTSARLVELEEQRRGRLP